MDSLFNEKDILLIGATNLPMEIDSAVRRRFEKRIYVPLPDYDARKAMFETWLQIKFSEKQEDIVGYLTDFTDGYSGADIKNICKTLNFLPVRKLTNSEYFFLNSENKYEICDEKHPGAIKTRLMGLAGKDIQTPMLTRNDVT